jgi:hypothetical protein
MPQLHHLLWTIIGGGGALFGLGSCIAPPAPIPQIKIRAHFGASYETEIPLAFPCPGAACGAAKTNRKPHRGVPSLLLRSKPQKWSWGKCYFNTHPSQ